ncbi:MAG: signal peptidase I [Dorea sp.]|nr:signal peptidase I [Dorea sp.]
MEEKNKKSPKPIPTVSELESELKREKYRITYGRTVRSTIYALVIVAAAAVLVAVLLLPVLQIYGGSMSPCLEEGNIVMSVKTSNLKQGDVIAFYYNNKILIKRVIAGPGEWVDIDEDGNVYVNQEKLDESYVKDPSLGDCNIELPYQVPDERYFVMGDHRSVSVDSRNSSVGCVTKDQIVGKIVFRIWPLNELGRLK